MGSLFASIWTAAGSMKAFETAIAVTGNNVTNASTPGFARQRLGLSAKRLELEAGLPGGVSAAGLQSARQEFLERSVRGQLHQLGERRQTAFSLERLEPAFDIAAGAGVAGTLDGLTRAVSQWTVSPNATPAREGVIRAAADVAGSFRAVAASIGQAAAHADTELAQTVDTINHLGGLIQGFNRELRSDARKLEDPGLDAQIHNALDELAELADFTVLRGDDGTFSVYLGGQTPLTIGESLYPLSLDLGSGAPVLRAGGGGDITGQFSSGRLSALISFRGVLLPGLLARLNRLAESVGSQVNGALAAGLDATGNPPTIDLFRYDTLTGAAASLDITAIQPSDLAAALPGAPGGNGNALQLEQLLGSRTIDNVTFSQFFGEIAGSVGRSLAGAREDEQAQTQLVAQARSIREDASGVSLDEEAANLIAFQRAYEASAQMVRVLNEMTESMIGILR